MHNLSGANDENEIPLVVDVDGSLVSGDITIEGAAQLLSIYPLNFFALLFWSIIAIVKGRASLKRRIAQTFPVPPNTLMLNPAVTNEIAAAKSVGREVWLASGSDELVVAPLAEMVGATGFFASDGQTNLVGQKKAAVLTERFGWGGFDYIGNERCDLAVWQQARHAIGVNLSKSLTRKLKELDEDARLLKGLGGNTFDYLRALRPHQWIKNVLVFTPLIAAQDTRFELYLLVSTLFIAFSICASGTYLLNDLLDLYHDRLHRTKRFRPMAAGKLSLIPAIVIGIALIATGLAISFWLSVATGLCILLYLFVTFSYSLLLKQKTYVDVVALATLYMIRVIAGGIVVSVSLSPWFLSFFIFFFLSLAIIKRQCELSVLHKFHESESSGSKYLPEDFTVMIAFGAASSVASVVIFTLYIQSLKVSGNFSRPELMWLICPLLIYWSGRMILLANRGNVNNDPLVFAMGDRTSWLTGIGILVAYLAAL